MSPAFAYCAPSLGSPSKKVVAAAPITVAAQETVSSCLAKFCVADTSKSELPCHDTMTTMSDHAHCIAAVRGVRVLTQMQGTIAVGIRHPHACPLNAFCSASGRAKF